MLINLCGFSPIIPFPNLSKNAQAVRNVRHTRLNGIAEAQPLFCKERYRFMFGLCIICSLPPDCPSDEMKLESCKGLVLYNLDDKTGILGK